MPRLDILLFLDDDNEYSDHLQTLQLPSPPPIPSQSLVNTAPHKSYAMFT